MRPQQGAVTVYATWVAVVLVTVTLLIVQVAALVSLRHRATAAADLAALAASRASVAGSDGCAAARDVAARNDARVERCRMDLDVATVTTMLESRPWWGGDWVVHVRARAAPAWYER